MEPNQRLSDRISSINDYGPEDEKWYHFVRDHKNFLKRKAKLTIYTPEQLVKYRYRPVDFYVNECAGQVAMAWIFMLINDIRDLDEFTENQTRLYIISPTEISTLYTTYSTSINHQEFEDL